MMSNSGRIRLLFLVLAAAASVSTPPALRASNITLNSLFTHDDELQLFSCTVASSTSVDLRRHGYPGGTTSSGASARRGDLETVMTLLDSSGNFLSEYDDGAGAATDPSRGLAGDAQVTTTLNLGSYILALTQYDTFALGNLSEGFVETETRTPWFEPRTTTRRHP